MAVVTDYLNVVFQTSGLSAVVGAFRTLQNATDRLQQSQAKMAASLTGTQKQQQSAFQNLANAAKGVENAELLVAQTTVQVGIQMAKAAYGAVEAWADLGKTILDVQGLTGATAERAGALVAQFRAAGLSSAQEIRELAELSKSVFTAQGRSALSFLGISADPTQDPIQLLNNVANALQTVQDPLRRNQLQINLFGQRGLGAMQAFLRMSKETREELERRGGIVPQEELDKAQRLAENVATMKAAFDFQFLRHLADDLTPWFTDINNGLKGLIDLFDGLHTALDGVGGAIERNVPQFKALSDWAVSMVAPFGGIIHPLSVLVNLFNRWAGFDKSQPDSSEAKNGPVDKFGASVDKFEAAINTMTDWQKWNRGGIPKGLTGDEVAISAITRAQALGAIG